MLGGLRRLEVSDPKLTHFSGKSTSLPHLDEAVRESELLRLGRGGHCQPWQGSSRNIIGGLAENWRGPILVGLLTRSHAVTREHWLIRKLIVCSV